MNCEHCKQHIVATTQISWRGYNYHTNCIGEAVAQYRAKTETVSANSSLPGEYDYQIDDDYFDEADDYEDADLEDLIDRLDDMPEVSDEVLNQIPVSVTNGENGGAQIPKTVREPVESFTRDVKIEDGAAVVSQARPTNGTLIAHCGANRINRGDLLGLPLPEETDTFKPVSHYFLVQAIEEALAFRHISITTEEFAVTPDGMKFFAVLQVNAQYEGVNFAIGLRNSNDKSMRLGIVAGYKVTVCDNLSFAGEYKPMLAKHSKNLDLTESVSIAVDRLQRGWKPIREMIDFKRGHELSDGKARDMLYQLFTDARLPISLFRTTHKEFFIKPSYDEFKPKTLWSLENAVTTSIKKLQPMSRYENTAKLGKFITDYTTNI